VGLVTVRISSDLVPDVPALEAAALLLVEWLSRLEELTKAQALLEAVPYVLEESAPLAAWREVIAGQTAHLRSRAAYAAYYDRQWEAPSPRTLEEIRSVCAMYPRMEWARAQAHAMGARRVLDVGCGNGAMALWLASEGFDTTGINLTAPAVAAASTVARTLGLPARFVLGHAETPAGDGFDLICCFETIEHVPDDLALLAALHAQLRPGGVLMVTTPLGSCDYGRHTWDDGVPTGPRSHVRAFTEASLRARFGAFVQVQTFIGPESVHPSCQLIYAAGVKGERTTA
jgi:2-polyprenyl-3-methyl-5-hydroxy-6-metoxy-1,4-benzoquinol methylase